VLQNFFNSEFCGLPQNSRKKFLASSPMGRLALYVMRPFIKNLKKSLAQRPTTNLAAYAA